MKRFLVAAVAALAGFASAQIPDVLIKIDVIMHARAAKGQKSSGHLYDSLGNYSTVGLTFTLEPGFRVYLAQRLELVDDVEDAQLDQYYIEDRGYWRLGRQKLPLGGGVLFGEIIEAARVDTYLGSDAWPIAICYADGGSGRQKGLLFRIGSTLGLTYANGRHFGIDPGTLATFRFPEDAPGLGGGYKEILAADFSKRLGGGMRMQAEFAMLRDPELENEKTREVSDVILWLEPDPNRSLGFGWSRDWENGRNEFRMQARVGIGNGVSVEPIVQVREGEVRSVGASLRVRF